LQQPVPGAAKEASLGLENGSTANAHLNINFPGQQDRTLMITYGIFDFHLHPIRFQLELTAFSVKPRGIFCSLVVIVN
jgi:hypothetical protein